MPRCCCHLQHGPNRVHLEKMLVKDGCHSCGAWMCMHVCAGMQLPTARVLAWLVPAAVCMRMGTGLASLLPLLCHRSAVLCAPTQSSLAVQPRGRVVPSPSCVSTRGVGAK